MLKIFYAHISNVYVSYFFKMCHICVMRIKYYTYMEYEIYSIYHIRHMYPLV